MRTIAIAAAALLAFAFVASPGGAVLPCNGNIIEIAVGSETVYIDDRADDPNAPPGSGFFFGEGTWIYLESNNREGLQSGGSNPWAGQQPLLVGVDRCSNADPDQLIF